MSDYDRVAQVIAYLEAHRQEQPDLTTLAEVVDLSPHHFQRLFTRWAGVSPKGFLQCLTLEHARQLLARGESVLGAALDAGLSGPGRLHDLTVKLEAASPGELKARGAGWTIRAGLAPSPFGPCLVGLGPRGIVHLSFPTEDERERDAAAGLVREDWPEAQVAWDDATAADVLRRAFAVEPNPTQPPLKALVRGTAFQLRVWRSLLRIPPGACVTYGQLAAAVGKPSANRAVGTAVGRNPISFLIPCHRVLRSTGALGGYRWGLPRKRAMLAWEGSRDAAARVG